eukprot:59914-Chlamydomonas_euryale.AAC.1
MFVRPATLVGCGWSIRRACGGGGGGGGHGEDASASVRVHRRMQRGSSGRRVWAKACAQKGGADTSCAARMRTTSSQYVHARRARPHLQRQHQQRHRHVARIHDAPVQQDEHDRRQRARLERLQLFRLCRSRCSCGVLWCGLKLAPQGVSRRVRVSGWRGQERPRRQSSSSLWLEHWE